MTKLVRDLVGTYHTDGDRAGCVLEGRFWPFHVAGELVEERRLDLGRPRRHIVVLRHCIARRKESAHPQQDCEPPSHQFWPPHRCTSAIIVRAAIAPSGKYCVRTRCA